MKEKKQKQAILINNSQRNTSGQDTNEEMFNYSHNERNGNENGFFARIAKTKK